MKTFLLMSLLLGFVSVEVKADRLLASRFSTEEAVSFVKDGTLTDKLIDVFYLEHPQNRPSFHQKGALLAIYRQPDMDNLYIAATLNKNYFVSTVKIHFYIPLTVRAMREFDYPLDTRRWSAYKTSLEDRLYKIATDTMHDLVTGGVAKLADPRTGSWVSEVAQQAQKLGIAFDGDPEVSVEKFAVKKQEDSTLRSVDFKDMFLGGLGEGVGLEMRLFFSDQTTAEQLSQILQMISNRNKSSSPSIQIENPCSRALSGAIK